METRKARWTLGELAEQLGGELRGSADLPIERPVSADSDDPLGIAFAESSEYLSKAANVGAVIVGRGVEDPGRNLIKVDNPRLAFGMLLALSVKPLPIEVGVHPSAVIHESAKIDPSAAIGPYVVVEQGASIGPRAQIYAFCYVGEGCSIGAGTSLMPHVVLYQDVVVGERCLLHSGVVLGADGFGFIWDGSKRFKVPQVGTVRIGNDVEIGANTTVDRATAGVTSIGDGVKLDNQIQIGHNSSIGDHTVIAGHSGISGSTKIGKRVVMGGGVGTNDHISITDDVVLGGRSGVDRDITEPGQYFGTPARPAAEGVRAMLLVPKLPELMSRIRALEKKVKELEEEDGR